MTKSRLTKSINRIGNAGTALYITTTAPYSENSINNALTAMNVELGDVYESNPLSNDTTTLYYSGGSLTISSLTIDNSVYQQLTLNWTINTSTGISITQIDINQYTDSTYTTLYNVYSTNAAVSSSLNNDFSISSTSYAITSLANNTTYYYKLIAWSSSTNNVTSSISGTTHPQGAISLNSLVQTSANPNKIFIGWSYFAFTSNPIVTYQYSVDGITWSSSSTTNLNVGYFTNQAYNTGNYVRLITSDSAYGQAISNSLTLTCAIVTITGYTQATPTSVNIAYTYTRFTQTDNIVIQYGATSTLTTYLTLSGYNLQVGGSGTILNVPIPAGNFFRIVVNGTGLDYMYATVPSSIYSSSVAYTTGVITLGSQTQVSPTTKTVQFTTNYPDGTTFTLYQSTANTSLPSGTWSSLATVTSSGSAGSFVGVSITNLDYIQISATTTAFGTSYSAVSPQETYSSVSVSFGSITQASTSTVNIPWTYVGYTGSETLQIQQSSDGSTYTNVGSSTTVGASPANGISITAGNYIRLHVTSASLGNTDATTASQWAYIIGSVTLGTITQLTTGTVRITWSSSGYLGSESLQIQQSSNGTTHTNIGSATTVGVGSSVVSITNGNYVRLSVTSTSYGSSTATSATPWTYTIGTVTVGSITQASPTTVNITWTYASYTGSESLQISQSSDGTTYTNVGSATTVGALSSNGVSISSGNYVRLTVTSALYGTGYSTTSSQWTYTVGSITLGSITQASSTTKTIPFTTNYPDGTTFTIYPSVKC